MKVSPAFISRVRRGERGFTLDHLELLESIMGAPLGALLLAAVPPSSPKPDLKRLYDLARKAILQGDRAAEKIKSSAPRPAAR